MDEIHEMVCTSNTDDVAVLDCGICGRSVLVGPMSLDVLVQGDQTARHIGGVGVGSMAVEVGRV